MVTSYTSRGVIAGEYCRACRSIAFSVQTTAIVQSSIFVLFIELFLIDIWDETENDKQSNFLRQAVSLSGEFTQLEHYLQTTCRFTTGNLNT